LIINILCTVELASFNIHLRIWRLDRTISLMDVDGFRDRVNAGIDRLAQGWDRLPRATQIACFAGETVATAAIMFGTPLHEYTIDPVLDFAQQVGDALVGEAPPQ
jgi:hypothetical protein